MKKMIKIMSFLVVLLFLKCAKQPGEFEKTNPLDPNNTINYGFDILGTYHLSREIRDISFYKNFIYIVNSYGLVILDISEPTSPSEVGREQLNDPLSIAVDEDVAYVLNQTAFDSAGITYVTRFLTKIYVIEPSSPQVFWEKKFTRGENIITASDGKGYLSCVDNVFSYISIIDTNANSDIIETWKWYPPFLSFVPLNAELKGDTLYALGGWSGLYIFTGAPHYLTQQSSFGTPDWIIDIEIPGNIAYATVADAGLISIDVQNIKKPTLIGQCDIPNWWVDEISVFGTTAYVIYYILNIDGTSYLETGVAAVDIRYPKYMRVIANYSDIVEAQGVYATEDVIYAIDIDKLIFLTLNPSSM